MYVCVITDACFISNCSWAFWNLVLLYLCRCLKQSPMWCIWIALCLQLVLMFSLLSKDRGGRSNAWQHVIRIEDEDSNEHKEAFNYCDKVLLICYSKKWGILSLKYHNDTYKVFLTSGIGKDNPESRMIGATKKDGMDGTTSNPSVGYGWQFMFADRVRVKSWAFNYIGQYRLNLS